MVLLWLRVAAVLYALSTVLILPAVLYGRPRWRNLGIPVAVAAFFFHFVSLVEMLSLAHRWLPDGMNEVASLLALLVAATFLLIAVVYRTVSFGIFALPLSLLLVLRPALGLGDSGFSSPLVRSGWLFLHISSLLTAYSALFFGLVAILLSLAQEKRLKRKKGGAGWAWLPPLDTTGRIGSNMLLIGFPFMTLGLLAGAVIAQRSVGATYFLDPKILLSFAMWALYLTMLFVREKVGFRGRRAFYLAGFGFLLVLSVWAANQVSTVHRFPAP